MRVAAARAQIVSARCAAQMLCALPWHGPGCASAPPAGLHPAPPRSAEEKQAKLQAFATTKAVALSQAGAADAAVTPSLKNLLLSVLAGGSVLVLIAAAVAGVANFDKLSRKD